MSALIEIICSNCNHKLPGDSKFCQYCGNKIDRGITVSTEASTEPITETVNTSANDTPVIDLEVDDEPNIDGMTPEEALNVILKSQAKEAMKIMEINKHAQPDNEGDINFGLVPEKPIFTLAFQSVDGERDYLDKLYTVNGEKIKYNRRCSVGVEGINGLIDVYDTYLSSGQPYKTIYINMYGAKKSTTAPAGFVINAHTQFRRVPKKIKRVKTKYCSRCGSVVDSKAKICTGCGKKYFKGIRFNKFSFTVIVLSLVIAVTSTLCILQYVNLSDQQATISWLNSKIDDLEEKNFDLSTENLKDKWALEFYDKYAACVNENSKKYHKYSCEDFDKSHFLIYNYGTAEQLGYYSCPKCH